VGNSATVGNEVLDLLDLEHYLNIKLVKLGHFLFLEISNAFLSVSKLLSDGSFTLFGAHAVLFKDENVVLDLVFFDNKVHTFVSEAFYLVEFVLFLGETSNASIIVLIFFLLGLLFFFSFAVFLVIIFGILFNLLLLSLLFNDAFEVAAEEVVLNVLRFDAVVELSVELLLLLFNGVDLVLLDVELLFDLAD